MAFTPEEKRMFAGIRGVLSSFYMMKDAKNDMQGIGAYVFLLQHWFLCMDMAWLNALPKAPDPAYLDFVYWNEVFMTYYDPSAAIWCQDGVEKNVDLTEKIGMFKMAGFESSSAIGWFMDLAIDVSDLFALYMAIDLPDLVNDPDAPDDLHDLLDSKDDILATRPGIIKRIEHLRKQTPPLELVEYLRKAQESHERGVFHEPVADFYSKKRGRTVH